MAADHLRVHVGTHVVDGELARIGRYLAVQDHLQQYVAQFLAQMRHVGGFDGVHGLVGLLDHVVRDALMRLLAVPRAAIRRTQCGNGGNELVECGMIHRMFEKMPGCGRGGAGHGAWRGGILVHGGPFVVCTTEVYRPSASWYAAKRRQPYEKRGNMARTEPHRSPRAAVIATRVAFALVFAINVQCALSFVMWPDAYAASYELSGVPGAAAVQGLGVAFLMWNATYPAVIVSPRRFRALGVVVIVQQFVGLVGETWILATLPAGHALLSASIERFIAFDALGLVLMAVTFGWLAASDRRFGKA